MQSVFLSKFSRNYEARCFNLNGDGARCGHRTHKKDNIFFLILLRTLLSHTAIWHLLWLKSHLCDLKRPVARNIDKIPLTPRAFAKNAFLRHFGDFQWGYKPSELQSTQKSICNMIAGLLFNMFYNIFAGACAEIKQKKMAYVLNRLLRFY